MERRQRQRMWRHRSSCLLRLRSAPQLTPLHRSPLPVLPLQWPRQQLPCHRQWARRCSQSSRWPPRCPPHRPSPLPQQGWAALRRGSSRRQPLCSVRRRGSHGQTLSSRRSASSRQRRRLRPPLQPLLPRCPPQPPPPRPPSWKLPATAAAAAMPRRNRCKCRRLPLLRAPPRYSSSCHRPLPRLSLFCLLRPHFRLLPPLHCRQTQWKRTRSPPLSRQSLCCSRRGGAPARRSCATASSATRSAACRPASAGPRSAPGLSARATQLLSSSSLGRASSRFRASDASAPPRLRALPPQGRSAAACASPLQRRCLRGPWRRMIRGSSQVRGCRVSRRRPAASLRWTKARAALGWGPTPLLPLRCRPLLQLPGPLSRPSAPRLLLQPQQQQQQPSWQARSRPSRRPLSSAAASCRPRAAPLSRALCLRQQWQPHLQQLRRRPSPRLRRRCLLGPSPRASRLPSPSSGVRRGSSSRRTT